MDEEREGGREGGRKGEREIEQMVPGSGKSHEIKSAIRGHSSADCAQEGVHAQTAMVTQLHVIIPNINRAPCSGTTSQR